MQCCYGAHTDWGTACHTPPLFPIQLLYTAFAETPWVPSLTCPVVLLFLLCLRDAANKRSLTFGPSWRSVPKSKSSGAILQELPSPSWARAPTGPGESRRGGPDSRQRLDTTSCGSDASRKLCPRACFESSGVYCAYTAGSENRVILT